MRDHPTPETLDRFLRGELPRAQTLAVIKHLVGGCRFCSAAAAPVFFWLPRDRERVELEEAGAAYDLELDRAFAAAGRTVKRHAREARLVRQAHAALAAEGYAGVNGPASRRFRGVPLCLALLRRSHELRHENPTEMLRLARLALVAVGRLDVGRLGTPRVADLEARALAAFGNAQRITGDLTAAERSFEQAQAAYEEGTQDPQLSADLLSMRAALSVGQRRFPQALDLLERAEAIYRELGDHHQEGQAVVQRGLYTGYCGQPKEAVSLLRRGLGLIDEAADPQLALAAVHNLVRSLADCGELREARGLLWQNSGRYRQHADRIILLKRSWLQGQIAAGLGELDRAADRLAEAMHGFAEAELGYQEALTALDLAAVWMRRGRSQSAIELIERAAETFAAIGISREAVACLRLLQEACELKLANHVYVQAVSTFFRRLEHDPTARFQK
ncbi:MAG TPA: hypothetical protein VF121_19455 [Thermoanaerobaculia bacterium]|nr:hypothetical protein [Thermoanaerobaculia bacterium]